MLKIDTQWYQVRLNAMPLRKHQYFMPCEKEKVPLPQFIISKISISRTPVIYSAPTALCFYQYPNFFPLSQAGEVAVRLQRI